MNIGGKSNKKYIFQDVGFKQEPTSWGEAQTWRWESKTLKGAGADWEEISLALKSREAIVRSEEGSFLGAEGVVKRREEKSDDVENAADIVMVRFCGDGQQL